MQQPFHLKRLHLFLLFSAVALLLHPLFLSNASFTWTFSEEGPYETSSVLLWLALAGALIFRVKPRSGRSISLSILCTLLAAREADLHKLYTTGSIFKKNYYFDGSVPLLEKGIAAVVALMAISLLLYVLVNGMRWLWKQRLCVSTTLHLIALAAGILVATKVMDRLPATLWDWFGYQTPLLLRQCMLALEEGFEAIVPLLFFAAAWTYRPGAAPAATAHSVPAANVEAG